MYNFCPFCESTDTVELDDIIEVHGINARSYYTICNICKEEFAMGWQLNASVFSARAEGCYKTQAFIDFMEGYSNGKEDCLLNN